MRVKVSEGKTKDVAIIDVTPDNYIVPDNEKHLYHCIIEIKKFDSETGKRLSIPRIQKFGKKGYENSIAENLKKQGYTITVLHDPNEYMKAKAEADEKAKAEKATANAEKAAADAKAKAEAEAKAKAEEKAALKAEILAELKAAGVIPAEPAKETKADAKAKAEAEDKPGAKK
jgi:colicin import membrane protein